MSPSTAHRAREAREARGSRRLPLALTLGLALLLLCVAISVVAALALGLTGETPDSAGSSDAGRTLVAVLDVGQGLSVAVISPDGRGLVYDAGNGASDVDDVILPFLTRHGIDRLDYLVLSHPHQDHVGGMPALLEAIPVQTFVDPVIESTNQAYARTLEQVVDAGIVAQRARRGDTLDLGERLTVEILWPRDPLLTDADGTEIPNDNSVVLKITHGDVSVLLTGDIERDAEAALVELDASALQTTILQIAHHGSRTSSTDPFLEAARPEIGIISAGGDNPYGHPHDEVMQRARAAGIRVYRTDVDGTVVIALDGSGYQVGLGGETPP